MKKSQPQSNLAVRIENGGLSIFVPGWRGFKLGPGRCRVVLDGQLIGLKLASAITKNGRTLLLWKSRMVSVEQELVTELASTVHWKNTLTYHGRAPATLDRVELWSTVGVSQSVIRLGARPARVRILENSCYSGQVRSVGQILSGLDGRKSLDGRPGAFASEAVTVLDDRELGETLLIGFTSFDRFNGWLSASSTAARQKQESAPLNVDGAGGKGTDRLWLAPAQIPRGIRFTEGSFGFNCGAIPVVAGQTVDLEEMVLSAGQDPDRLLEEYADRVARRYAIHDLPEPFVNWCSWYAYRLRVSEEVVVATARQAKARHLDELGLRILQADLGWERDNIPTYFEENERFSRGLPWLAKELQGLGFDLGAWKGFTFVSANHPIAREHPDWLVQGKDGKPVDGGRWFWEPHDQMFSLDLSHPGVQRWVADQVGSLWRRGVRYLKWDFGGNISTGGQRYDPAIACAGALEGMRIAAKLVRDAMHVCEGGLVLNCTGCETGAMGLLPIIYSNADTGNTGIGFHHLRNVYSALGTHLFKNRRWGLLQPSCLVVGPPGTVEEARLRATVTFLTGGHTDISDDLIRLPEDRWRILLATLPPLPVTARVVDLFHPVRISVESYEGQCKGASVAARTTTEPQGATVWQAHVKADWDEWDLVAVLHWFHPEQEASGHTVPMRFQIPFRALGMNPTKQYWAHEFWSGQFLGKIPVAVRSKGAYRHPGDYAALVTESAPGILSVAFQGPAVKLLVIRRPRQHPWPVATTFHQSGGMELSDVEWDARRQSLSGKLHRPPGETGLIVVAGIPAEAHVAATVNGQSVSALQAANGSLALPVSVVQRVTRWQIRVTARV